MQCPIGGCDNAVEPGPNSRVTVEKGSKEVSKMVCNECADWFWGHIHATE